MHFTYNYHLSQLLYYFLHNIVYRAHHSRHHYESILYTYCLPDKYPQNMIHLRLYRCIASFHNYLCAIEKKHVTM